MTKESESRCPLCGQSRVPRPPYVIHVCPAWGPVCRTPEPLMNGCPV